MRGQAGINCLFVEYYMNLGFSTLFYVFLIFLFVLSAFLPVIIIYKGIL